MRMHPRVLVVDEAKNALSVAIATAVTDLTEAEAIQVVSGACHEWISTVCKYNIRQERHGDTDTPGGWETQSSGKGGP